jgi:CubicO group peptidase (beta-lactamase class C family)
MRLFFSSILLAIFFSSSTLFASVGIPDYGRSVTIEFLIERAITNNLIGGGVVVIGNHDGILSSTSRGRLNASPDSPLLDEQTIFDIASLTKVIATTPAIMKLVDEGRISLKDPLIRWFPEFKGSDLGNATILHLLTHTSGLTDFDMSSNQAMKTAVLRAAAEINIQRPGSSFNYADINFILLGELVQRVSGRTLDVYCREEIFAPLFTSETMFLPTLNFTNRIAPTVGADSGTVQDRNSRRLGSVAGHAGLFSSAQDLSRFARLLLAGGVIDGRRILSEQAVKQMTAPFSCSNSGVVRGLGWDIKSPYSAPKGKLFSEVSFGHTGYSGSSIWIDPGQDLFVVLLTNRLNYKDIRGFNQLRSDISTIAVEEFQKTGDSLRIATIPDITKIPLTLQKMRVAMRKKPAGRHGVRLASASHVHSKSYSHNSKKSGKIHRHKSSRIRRV